MGYCSGISCGFHGEEEKDIGAGVGSSLIVNGLGIV